MLASPPLRDCAADVQRLFVAVDLGLVKDSTDAAMLRGRGPFETTMSFGGRDAAASFGEASAIVGAIVDMTVAADAHYFVGGMGISTFDRGVVDMRSTRDQYRAAPATPATVPSWSGATADRSRRSGTLRRFRESPRSRTAITSRRSK